MQHIHCTVSNCHYWDSENVCLAQEILVTVDQVAADLPDRYDANNMMEVSQEVGSIPADKCESTCCKTFSEKGSNHQTVAKITRKDYEKGKGAKS